MNLYANRRLIRFFCSLFVLAALTALLAWIVIRSMELDNYKGRLTAWLEARLNRQVQYKHGTFSIFPVPSFVFDEISITEKDRKTLFLSAQKLTFKVPLRALLQKRIVFSHVVLQGPEITIRRDINGNLNIDDFLKQKGSNSFFELDTFHIKNGALKFIDASSLQIELTDISLSMLKQTLKGYLVRFTAQSKKDSVSLEGTVTTMPGTAFAQTPFELHVTARRTDVQPYAAYLQSVMPFVLKEGRIDADSSFSGTLSDFASKGNVSFIKPVFAYQPFLQNDMQLNSLTFAYDFKKNSGQLFMRDIQCNINDTLTAHGNVKLRHLFTNDPYIDATLNTSAAPLKEWEQLFNNISPNPFDSFKEHAIIAGRMQLIEGKVKGRVSQIKKGVVYGKIGFNEVSVNPQIQKWPVLSNLDGIIELDKDKAVIQNAKGYAGKSVFTVGGEIQGLANESKSFNLSAQIALHENEAVKLLRNYVGSKFRFKGNSSLSIKVSGTTDKPSFEGAWDLTQSGYDYKNLFIKGAGKKNIVNFTGTKTKGWITFRNNITLGNIFIDLAVGYTFGKIEGVVVDVQSRPFLIDEGALYLPFFKRYLVTGRTAITAHGEGRSMADLRWQGNLKIEHGSVYGLPWVKLINDIEGTVHYEDRAFHTPSLKGRVGEAQINVAGNFQRPSLKIQVTAPKLYLSDFGLVQQKGLPLAPENFKASFSIRGRQVNILSLQAIVNDSVINLTGTIVDSLFPRVQLYVDTKRLNLSDVLLVTGIRPDKKLATPTRINYIKATIHSDSGYIHTIPYDNLYTNVNYQSNVVRLEPIRFNALGGRAEANMDLDFFISGWPAYKMDFSLNQVDAEDFFNFLGIQRKFIEGDLDLSGSLSSKGAAKAMLIQNLSGNTR
ncbi:MAG TPA: AsmA family protein, partial [Thermodesulfovibrionia bacterium]|nr:AsmA family protein [Thermodesulfovibrionia bacterium]